MEKSPMKKAFSILRLTVAVIAALCLVAAAALYCVSGGFMKQTYMEPWSKSYAGKYADPRMRLASVGLLAASNHNMQPWKISLDKSDPMVFYLYADSSRMTKEVDPYSRQLMISQGTFLEYVAVAGEKEGYRADISLFPDGAYDESDLAKSMDSKPVARIALNKQQPGSSMLYDASFLPDTNRGAYRATKLTGAQVAALEALSSADGVSVTLYQDRIDLGDIGRFALRSASIEAGVSRVMGESDAIFRANERQKNQYRYGYSVEGQGVSGFMKHMLQGLVTIFPSMNAGAAASENFIKSTAASVGHTPAYAMIRTAGNSRLDQVESGMAYSRMVLIGHTLGLAMQPLSQVLEEYPEMKAPYDEFKKAYAPDGGTVQMLLRVGVATRSVPLSMRRDVQSLIRP
ncbi:hypothetical protein DDE84_08925 [Bifidobacterium tibiigranuli]|jgi:hypothetical protein|uniref:Nitroreductase domain-containing protein n=2 Tax=Bifidobacterium tibiigranuli TaxID=2172043 RepID=A0A5N6RZ82_9BIFI|nr:hypothetical protein DDE84_08925 [Bifidobacterium tibiigranuli]KAE8127635.1 hypothetical protein DDF78_08160 [Bifidobacterium tibiigranuli]